MYCENFKHRGLGNTMTIKQTDVKKQEAVRAPDKSRDIRLLTRPGVSEDRMIAEYAFDPTTANASTALDFSTDLLPSLSLQDCAAVMKEGAQAVTDGNLGKLESMLNGQAIALNAMFNNFAKRAMHADVMPKLEAYFRLALKAQSQCRSTVEALAEIKYPKSATFIKQANIAGQQQVNNSTDGQGSKFTPRAREKNITPTNELLTEAKHANLDKRATGAASRGNPQVETVGAVNRADQ